MNWLIARLHESSTWRGIILLLTVFGMNLEPDQQEAIIAAGLAIVGLLGVFTRDKTNDEVVKPPIELQSRSDRRLLVPGAVDSRESALARSPVNRDGQSQRVSVAMQSPISSESRSDTKPNFTSGFNDQ
jgi:hypothetical protein